MSASTNAIRDSTVTSWSWMLAGTAMVLRCGCIAVLRDRALTAGAANLLRRARAVGLARTALQTAGRRRLCACGFLLLLRLHQGAALLLLLQRLHLGLLLLRALDVALRVLDDRALDRLVRALALQQLEQPLLLHVVQ